MSTVPHHLSESLFRYFEPHIALAVTNWPKETAFDMQLIPPAERYSAATFVARFRDAILSLKRFGWETKTIDTNKLWSMSGEFCIWLEPKSGLVWFKKKERAGRPTHMIGEARRRGSVGDLGEGNISLPSPVLQKDLTDEELRAFVVLLNTGRISGPVLVQGKVDDQTVEAFTTAFDVSFTWNERDNTTVII